jgi:hypothetical protein
MKSLIRCAAVLVSLASANVALAACPTADSVCSNLPPVLGMTCPTVTGYCEGEDCMNGARGDYILVSASDDPEDVIYDGYTIRWLARHSGLMANINCEALIDHRHGTFIILPEQQHCVTVLTDGDEVHLEFIASTALTTECNGWTECLCE